jgi:glutamyl endopeptidase
MKHVSFVVRGLVAAVALTFAPIPAYAQSNHEAVSNDGSVVASEAAATAGSARPSSGKSSITTAELSAEGVSVASESAARFSRLKALRDPAESGQEVIIGPDTRERLYTTTYPSRAKVLITFSAGRCSGTMIGPNTVATAGHCVHSGGAAGAWYSVASFRIYPGRDGASSPYGVCTARSLHSVTGWTVSGNEEYDYGAIKLNCTVGNTVGWFGITSATPTDFPSIIGGYPGDKPLTQWTSSDRIRVVGTRQVFYLNDTIGGQSGSAVWYDRSGPYMIGIHAYGTHGAGSHALYNHGVRITSGVFNNLVAWKNAP